MVNEKLLFATARRIKLHAIVKKNRQSPHMSTIPATPKIWSAVLVFGLSIAAIYGVEYFGLGGRGLLRVLGGLGLLAVLILNAKSLIKEFYAFPITYWGTGLAFLLVALRLYVMLEAAPENVSHLSTAKWLVLLVFPLGLLFLGYGLFLRSEMQGMKPDLKWETAESLNGLLLGIDFLTLLVLANQFVLRAWW